MERPAPDIFRRERREWLETDGLGGYASGPVSGPRTRRYHATLLVAGRPPAGRVVLVNGFDAWVETAAGRHHLTTQRYAPGVDAPADEGWCTGFAHEPWPRWTYRLPAGVELTHEIVVPQGVPATVLTWSAVMRSGPVRLVVRPYLSGRDHHATHRENAAFRLDADVAGERVTWRPYDSLPAIVSLANAEYSHDPDWYRNFQYDEERARGLDWLEDLVAPGTLTFDLRNGDAVWVLVADTPEAAGFLEGARDVRGPSARVRTRERTRRAGFATPLHRAADQFIVRRGTGHSIIAGYPWFTDWGRDTFIAVRGLCLATRRFELAASILRTWSEHERDGLLPNHFPDSDPEPERNSVDASLWFIVATYELMIASTRAGHPLDRDDRSALGRTVLRILEAYARGTLYGIRADGDGLLAAGEPGLQLTWMDARVDGREVTPRIGKPVEVQALWLNALRIGARLEAKWGALHDTAAESFVRRFIDPASGGLIDVVDVDHEPGRVDASIRPNQILAVGGLPFPVLAGEPARSVVDVVERKLRTPLGLRTLDPDASGYRPHCTGGPDERDAAYHQGTVWPWLAGPFIEAWLRVRGNTAAARAEARRRLLPPLVAHLETAGLGHVSEIADGAAPHTPHGCPFQAWSLGELVRIVTVLLGPHPRSPA